MFWFVGMARLTRRAPFSLHAAGRIAETAKCRDKASPIDHGLPRFPSLVCVDAATAADMVERIPEA
jgi:hypothetical protein